MTQAKGSSARLLLDFETTYGSDPVAPDAMVMPVNTININADQSKNSAATLGNARNPYMPWDGNLDVSGSIVVPVDYTAIWYWMKAMFNDPVTSGGPTYTHTFKVPISMPSLVLEKQFVDITKYWKYNGCKINRMSMDIGGDQELTMTLDIVGADETLGTSAYDATPTSLSLARLDNFEASLKEGGSPIANVRSLSFNLDFGLDPDQFVIGGAGIRGGLPEGIMAVSGTLTALFEDHTLAAKAEASTETSLEIDIMSGSYGVKFYFDELQLARGRAPVEGPRGVNISFDWVAYYDDDADASVIKVEVINTDAHA